MKNPKRPFARSLAFAAMTLAALTVGAFVPARAMGDEIIYLDGPVQEFGGNAIAPNGSPMAYFTYSQYGNSYFNGSVTDAPLSPQGGDYIVASIGATPPAQNNTYGGTGMAYIVSTVNAAQVTKDLSSYAGGTLSFWLRSDRTLVVEIQWDNGAGGNVSSTGYNVASTGGVWQKIAIPLTSASFGAGVAYNKIKVPFLIRIPGQETTDTIYRIDDVRWVASGGGGPPVTAGGTLEFYNDSPMYPFSNGTVFLNYIVFTPGGATKTFDLLEVGSTPEGNKRGRLTIDATSDPNSSAGGWGIQFKDGANVVDQNLSGFAGGALRFLVNSNEDLGLEMQDNVHVVTLTLPSTGGVWRERVVDLQLFVNQGIDLSRITVPFLIRRIGAPQTAATWYIDHVRWTKALSSLSIIPTTTWTATNRHRQFTVVGKDAANEEVVVYGAWSTSGGSGYGVSISTDSRYTIATIGSGAATIKATVTTSNSNISTATPNVSIPTPGAPQDGTFGILSETLPGVVLNTDALFGTYFDNTGASINTTSDATDFREGTQSTKVTLNVPAGKYAGFFIQNGLTVDETDVKNMADYYDGSVRFWLKAPPALAGKLDMSIRTGGVVTELSKVTLGAGQGMTFDNQWHAVVVPIAQLAKAVPFAELSRIKLFFNMSVSNAAGSGGSQTFWIDNIHWDTRTPGPLATISVKPMGNAAARVRIPKSLKRTFIAHGFDANGVEVDIYPTWSFTGAIGSLSTTTGPRTRLDASVTPALGTITATDSSVSTTTYIDVANITFTQNFNVYSDAGSGGQIGTDQSAGSVINLNGNHTIIPGAPEGKTVMLATYTVSGANAYATWFDYETVGSRFMNSYSDGYLHFWIKTGRDLEVSLRSDNIDPAANLAKFRLSDLGVPTDNTWQEVWLSLDDFKIADPRFDFSQVKVYFAIAAIQSEIGNVSNEVFLTDDVKWYTANAEVPDVNKVYAGVKSKQGATGLVLTYDNNGLSRAVTYDQALAAMSYTYHQDAPLAKKVLDVYKTKYNGGAGFVGFQNEFDRDTLAVRDADRMAGPNAWIMLAALHYKAATGSTTYDAMITGIANWIVSLQAGDGAIQLGNVSGSDSAAKSTEHNFDVYAAFKAYKAITGLTTYDASANSVYNWLTTPATSGGAFNTAEGRFNTGEFSNGSANNDFALDTYSWAPLALSSYTAVINQAETTFGVTKNVDVNGNTMTGFDFSSYPGENVPPVGKPVDKDAVWVEGTGHMVLAYLAANNQAKATQYLNELDKAVYTVGVSSQALPYASNAGTAYWYPGLMDSTHGSLSSMCWYLFAKTGFNPLQPVPLWGVVVKNISDNSPAVRVDWSATVPTRWVRSNQYIEFQAQPIDTRPWGVQIYTDNTNPAQIPHFVDPTPGITSNFDSNPAGLIEALPGNTTTYRTLDMGWKIQDSTQPAPAAIQPYSSLDGTGDFTWSFFKDLHSPAIDVNGNGTTTDPVDRPAFTPGEPYITVKSNAGIQTVSGSFFPSLNPDYLYIEADFTPAGAQTVYKANILLEYFIQ